jgi:Ser/Thr protein kinase RdoA (MazF antagonist)
MKTFPVTASTLSAEHLASFIQQQYALQNAVCTLFRTGINHTYIVSSNNEKFVFRVYFKNWRSISEIQEELNLLLLLHKNSIAVTYPIADKGYNFIQTINAPEGTRYGVLFSFAKGEKIRFLSTDTCASIGSLMANIHLITEGRNLDRITYDANTLITQPYKLALNYFNAAMPEMQYLKEISSELQDALEKAIDYTSSGTVHLDIWYDNMSIDKNRIILFDFDFCGNGSPLLDVAYFCNQLFNVETDKTEYEQKVNLFIEGYKKVKNLSSEQINLIPKIAPSIFIFYLGVQCQRFDWSNIFLSNNYLKMYVGRIKLWIDYYKDK